MKEFKYKGAIVRPYEPFGFYASESFFNGSIGGVFHELFVQAHLY